MYITECTVLNASVLLKFGTSFFTTSSQVFSTLHYFGFVFWKVCSRNLKIEGFRVIVLISTFCFGRLLVIYGQTLVTEMELSYLVIRVVSYEWINQTCSRNGLEQNLGVTSS